MSQRHDSSGTLSSNIYVMYALHRMLHRNIVNARAMAYKLHESGPVQTAAKVENVNDYGSIRGDID